jgi:uncharacterized coiled-coil protein SlyX
MNRSPLRVFVLTPIVLACFALSPHARAVDPPPDGGYPNQNTAEGEDALFIGGLNGANTAIGYHALYSDDFGASNTAVGSNALYSTVGAYFNTGVGADALSTDTEAGYNTAVGYSALNGIVGFGHTDNVALGFRAMALADSYGCIAIGSEALLLNKGQLNVAIGNESLNANSTGLDNTAVGWRSLFNNSTGYSNTVTGLQAMFFNTTGNENIAIGVQAMLNNTSGSNNIAIGNGAGSNLTRGGNNVDIGNQGMAGESGIIRLGTEGTQTATYIAGIRNSPLAVATGVGITADGQLGVRASSARYKEVIRPMDKASEAILALKPVTFRYKHDLDPNGIPQFGLVAEEVERVNPDLVARDEQGKPYTVRYEAVNAMLLNEFLKEHRTVQEQKATIAELKHNFAEQQKQIKALTSGLEKVSAQLETSKPAPQTVSSNQ